ncbi:MAG: tyrosine-type recombinase/integrase [Bacteroidota bacterium]
MKIQVQAIEHKGEKRIKLSFERNEKIIAKIKQIKGRKWSQTKRCWHLPYNRAAFEELKAMFGDDLVLPQKKESTFEVRQAKFFVKQQFGKQYQLVVGEEIIVDEYSKDWLAVFVPYDKKGWIEIIKNIDGRRWNSDKSCWLIPYVQDSLERLEQIESLHFNFEVRTNIPEYFPKAEKVQKKPSGKDLLNNMQQKAVTALEEKLLLERKSWRTIKTYKNLLIALLLYYPKTKPSSISEQQISRYFLHKIKEHQISVSTQGQMINSYKAFFERVLKQSGKVTVKRPKKSKQLPNVFSKEEIKLLLKAVDNQKHKAILALVYSAGLRRSEVLNLRINDILFSRKCIFVKSGKGRKDRYVLLSEKAAILLEAYIKASNPKYWLFEGEKGGQYSETSIQNIFQRAKKKAMINTYVTLHGLRHSFATHLLENNVPLSAIQEMLGHASIKTTEIYLHISDQFRKQLKSPLDDIDFD